MADSLVYDEPLRIDWLRFRIGVRWGDKGFFGEWYCAACDLGGGHTLPLSTLDLARTGADANLRIHHAIEHRNKKARRFGTPGGPER